MECTVTGCQPMTPPNKLFSINLHPVQREIVFTRSESYPPSEPGPQTPYRQIPRNAPSPGSAPANTNCSDARVLISSPSTLSVDSNAAALSRTWYEFLAPTSTELNPGCSAVHLITTCAS